MTDPSIRALSSSFRDPSGHLFESDGVLYRHVAPVYAKNYAQLMDSGLYQELVSRQLLIPHETVDAGFSPGSHTVLKPERVSFISYPYEWSFGMLRHAALITLRIQEIALEHGMSLKDASAYNVQFVRGRPVLIDTLSFETYEEGKPWVAYRQFCQHFLAPLALMAYRDVRMSSLLQRYIDGIPLDICARLLPFRTRLRPGLAIHIHAHARAQAKFTDHAADSGRKGLSKRSMLGLVDSLRGTTRRLRWKPGGTVWGDYYESTNYSSGAADAKRVLVEEFLQETSPETVWDLGANDGRYSRLACERGAWTIAFDIDPAAVEQAYRFCRKNDVERLLPLVLDLSNPSPAIGWAHVERMSLLERGPADCVMALALVHHLAIGNNVPWPSIAAFCAAAGRSLIVEYVPKEDSQVQRMLRTREDVFTEYGQESFEAAFSEYFGIVRREAIAGSTRTLYLMRRSSD